MLVTVLSTPSPASAPGLSDHGGASGGVCGIKAGLWKWTSKAAWSLVCRWMLLWASHLLLSQRPMWVGAKVIWGRRGFPAMSSGQEHMFSWVRWRSPGAELHSLSFIIIIIIIFYFTILYWFCHTSTCIRHWCTCVLHPEPPPSSLPIPSLWVIPVHQPQASCILHRTWTGNSFLMYYTCFNAILPNHLPPTCHRVQKTVLYICVSFAVMHIYGI